MVDGYGWPIGGIFDLNWHEKTKYRVDPGFYDAEVSLLVNLDTWKRLTPRPSATTSPAGPRARGPERLLEDLRPGGDQAPAQAGIEVIRFEGAQAQQYVDRAYEAGWAGVVKASPEHGPKMRELFSRR